MIASTNTTERVKYSLLDCFVKVCNFLCIVATGQHDDGDGRRTTGHDDAAATSKRCQLQHGPDVQHAAATAAATTGV